MLSKKCLFCRGQSMDFFEGRLSFLSLSMGDKFNSLVLKVLGMVLFSILASKFWVMEFTSKIVLPKLEILFVWKFAGFLHGLAEKVFAGLHFFGNFIVDIPEILG